MYALLIGLPKFIVGFLLGLLEDIKRQSLCAPLLRLCPKNQFSRILMVRAFKNIKRFVALGGSGYPRIQLQAQLPMGNGPSSQLEPVTRLITSSASNPCFVLVLLVVFPSLLVVGLVVLC